jgi:outer membrane protein TolC
VAEQRPAPALPKYQEEAINAALESNKDLRRLESQIISKGFEVKGEKAQRLPRVDLVAQYSLLATFNNYAQYFSKFQRNNGEIGLSIQWPLLAGTALGAEVAQSEADITHLKIDLNNTRNKIRSDLEQAYRTVRRSGTAAGVPRHAPAGGRSAGGGERQVDGVLRRAVRERAGALGGVEAHRRSDGGGGGAALKPS